MNIIEHLPYWSLGRIYENRFELQTATPLDLVGWQHPDQTGEGKIRPDGHAIRFAIDIGSILNRVIGLATLIHCQNHPDQRPEIFQNIHMCGWLDVIRGPCGDREFVPTLTPQNKIHWMDLNSGFNCLDFVPLRKRT